MKQVRVKMIVDPINLLERKKMRFNDTEDGNNFVKWLSYM